MTGGGCGNDGRGLCGNDGRGLCGIMSIRRKKAFCLMVLIKHVISIPLPHMKRTPLLSFPPKAPLPSFPTKGPLPSFPPKAPFCPSRQKAPFRPSRQRPPSVLPDKSPPSVLPAKGPPSVLPAKGPLLSFPTLVIGNPESSLPDVSFSDVRRFPEVMVGPGTSGVGAERPLFDADP